MSDLGRRTTDSRGEDQPASTGRSNTPLIAIFVLAGLILLGAFAYAFMMTMPASMPGMGH